MSSSSPAHAAFSKVMTVAMSIDPASAVALDAIHRQILFDLLYLVIPTALLCSLFCARLGVERGQALRGGPLPSVVFFCMGLFVAGWTGSLAPRLFADAPVFGMFLLAAFAVLRADPPASVGVGVGWMLAAGILGVLCMGDRMDAVSSVGGLGLYLWWSAGGRRAFGFGVAVIVGGGIVLMRTAFPLGSLVDASSFLYLSTFFVAAFFGYGLRRWMPPDPSPVYGPQLPGTLPSASAHRITGGLIFFTLMGLPAATVGDWEFVAWPLGVAVCLILTSLLTRAVTFNPAAPSPLPAATPPPHVPILPR